MAEEIKKEENKSAGNTVLCGANSYEEKYYFNEEFTVLPDAVKQELQIACVLFTEEVGGIITIEFNESGDVIVKVASDDRDYLYDNIESELSVRNLLKEKEDLFKKLETFYKVARLGKSIEEINYSEED